MAETTIKKPDTSPNAHPEQTQEHPATTKKHDPHHHHHQHDHAYIEPASTGTSHISPGSISIGGR